MRYAKEGGMVVAGSTRRERKRDPRVKYFMMLHTKSDKEAIRRFARYAGPWSECDEEPISRDAATMRPLEFGSSGEKNVEHENSG